MFPLPLLLQLLQQSHVQQVEGERAAVVDVKEQAGKNEGKTRKKYTDRIAITGQVCFSQGI